MALAMAPKIVATLEAWPRDTKSARAMQEAMTGLVVERDRFDQPGRIAGVDCHYDKERGLAYAAVALIDAASGELLESVLAAGPLSFPYVPGLLSFREVPVALKALACLSRPPDLLMVDGQGRAHPRRIGLASHLGVMADLPSIGVAKSRLIGSHEEPPPEPGGLAPLEDKGEIIGAVLRSKQNVRPLFISVGHRVTLATSVRLVMEHVRRHRLPEPTRLADRLSRCHG
jgi:deoxyribonuclease V